MINLQSKSTITSLLFTILIFINQKPSSSRNLGTNHHHHHHKIKFYMQNILNFNTSHTLPPKTTSLHLPFPKPLGLFPPNGGIPISESNPNKSPTLDVPNGIFFPSRATLQELELGTVVVIDEDLFRHDGSLKLGKAQGICVGSNESRIVAMVVRFSENGLGDGLRLFGVYGKDGGESHVAVIGGTGKFDGANGYATVEGVGGGSNVGGEVHGANKLLVFHVYLS